MKDSWMAVCFFGQDLSRLSPRAETAEVNGYGSPVRSDEQRTTQDRASLGDLDRAFHQFPE